MYLGKSVQIYRSNDSNPTPGKVIKENGNLVTVESYNPESTGLPPMTVLPNVRMCATSKEVASANRDEDHACMLEKPATPPAPKAKAPAKTKPKKKIPQPV